MFFQCQQLLLQGPYQEDQEIRVRLAVLETYNNTCGNNRKIGLRQVFGLVITAEHILGFLKL